MSTLEIPLPDAFLPLYEPHRYKVFYGGRGGAKSWNFARAILALGIQRPLTVLCAREIQSSIKESVHGLLAAQIDLLGLQGHYEVLGTEIRGANGTRIIYKGLWRNATEIKSTEGVDICWIEEAEKVSEESWRILIPTIRKERSEIWISFNPRHKHDATYQRFVVDPPPGALVRKVSWRDNPWFGEELRAEMEHDRNRDYEGYQHIWEGEFQVIAEGAIYAKQIIQARKDGRITDLPIERNEPVFSFWDLGKNDHTAVWIMQRVGLQNRFIDYIEGRQQELSFYVQELHDREREFGYRFREHYLPHDVEHDILGMKHSRREQLEHAGIKPIVVVPRINHINEGIEMVRQVFPTCWFDEVRCERGIDALSNYQYAYNELHGTHQKTPLHNWASDGADAFRQFAQGYRGPQSGWGAQLKPKDRAARRRKEVAWRDSDTSWVV